MAVQLESALIVAHHPTGASTGYMEDLRGRWPRLVQEALEVSPWAIELAALGEDELPGLLAYLGEKPALPFRYLSVHAPVKGRALAEQDLVATLAALPPAVDAIVVHPDLMEDPARYAAIGRRLVIENMDDRKPTGRTADELAPLFAELPDAGLCFDVAHAGAIDPDMGVAEELLDRFRRRLRHIHISSLDEDGGHATLTSEDEQRFEPVLRRCRDVPWILEAPPA
ncbi:MAG TPA: TIM barrel protein [Solirubrobacteraceae bacterium]|nr:TIM barrel protein [Solirubrobacteraceae bacterium]